LLYGDVQFNPDSSCFTAAVLVDVNSCLPAIGCRYDDQAQSQEGRKLVTFGNSKRASAQVSSPTKLCSTVT